MMKDDEGGGIEDVQMTDVRTVEEVKKKSRRRTRRDFDQRGEKS